MSFVSRRNRSETPIRQPRLGSDSADQFRRSRTITGSASSRVASATEERGQLRSPRLQEQDLRAHRRHLGRLFVLSVLAVGVCLALLDQLIVTPRMTIMPIDSTAMTKTYDDVIQQYFNARPLERFRFLLQNQTLAQYVSEKLPEVSSVVIADEQGLAASRAVVTLRHPLARWQLGQKTYYVDESGVAFEKNYLAPPALSVKDESGLPLAAEQIVGSTKMMKFIGQTVGMINRQGLGTVKELIIPPATLKEIDVVLQDRPYRLRMNVDREPYSQVGDMANALRYISAQGITPKYVDLRIPSKAYYLD